MAKVLHIVLLALAFAAATEAAPPAAQDPTGRLHTLFRDHHLWLSREFPEYSMSQGN